MSYCPLSYFVSACIVTFLSINVNLIVAGDVPESIKYETSLTETSNEAYNQIGEYIDSWLDPCDNFYDHVCAKWRFHYQFFEKDIIDQLDVLKVKKKKLMLRWFRDLLYHNKTVDDPTERLLVDYYRSCQDLDELERKGLSVLQTIIAYNGGWPMILPDNVWNPTKLLFPLKKIHENYSKIMERGALFHFGVYPDSSNGTHLLHILPRQWHPVTIVDNQLMKRSGRTIEEENCYLAFMKKVAKAIAKSQGVNVTNAKLTEDAWEILDLEDSLVELYSTVPRYETGVGQKYTIRTIAEVQRMWDRKMAEKSEYAINWLEAVQSAFVGTGIRINETDNIALSPETIIDELADVLKKFSLRTVVNYIHWTAISGLVQYTNKQMRRYVDECDFENNGTSSQVARRSDICYDDNKMNHAMLYAFVQEFYPKHRRDDDRAIVEDMNEIMMKKIEGSSRIDPDLKIRSKKKLDIMAKNVGYPVWYDEPGKIHEYHRGLEFSRRDYLKNVVRYIKFEKRKQLMKLRQPYDRLEAELEHMPEVFQMPFYLLGRRSVITYGVIGSLVGPALALGFMNEGEVASKDDNVARSKKWLSQQLIRRFADKSDCILGQYHRRHKINVLIHPTSVKEIFAANIGFPVALEAYFSFKENHNLTEIGEQPLADYSENQKFFYSLTNRMCALHFPPESEKFSDRRIPIRDRINSAFSNMEEFSKAFECSVGTPMNPDKKCRFFDHN